MACVVSSCAGGSEGVPRNVHTHARSRHRTSRRVLPARRYLLIGVLALPCLAHSLFPVSLSGAIPHVGGKGEAFVFCIGRIISLLAAGRITPKVIICKAHLSLLEIALFCFLFFPLFTGGYLHSGSQ